MGPKLFARLLEKIADLDTGHKEFIRGPDAVGENGAFAVMR